MKQRIKSVPKRRTLFGKYMRTVMLIIVISFMLLGAMVVTFVSEHWRNEKCDLLLRNANGIADIVSNHSENSGNTLYIYDSDIIKRFMSVVELSINSEIFITDVRGKIILYSNDQNGYYFVGKKIPQGVMDEVMKGQYDGIGNMEGIYEAEYYVVGVPLKVNDRGREIYSGAVFISSKSGVFSQFRLDVLKIVAIASAIAAIISFWVARRLSYSMTSPLREMSDAAVCMGKGDFSKRVAVKSEDEIGELAETFNNMAESLSVSENVRRSFISNVSHEFKTPMTTIAGFIDGVLDGTIPEKNHEYYLRIVSSEIKRLSRLVKTMLDLSRIDSESLKIDYKRFSITSIIADVVISFEKRIQEKNIEIYGMQECIDIFIYGDRDMIYQAIYNLIDNAIKFTDDSGSVTINIRSDSERRYFSVENTGQGISKEEIGFIFDRFYKTDKSRSEDKNGMGLGLYIVKKIINLHGGDIKVLSVPNEYTRFEFWVPGYIDK